MKPSKRIIQLFDKWHPNNPIGDVEATRTSDMLSSIMTYLDEEWEKNQPCPHTEYEDWHGANVCKKCKMVFSN